MMRTLLYVVAGLAGCLLLTSCALEPGQIELLTGQVGDLALEVERAATEIEAIEESNMTTGEKVGAIAGVGGGAVGAALAIVRSWRGKAKPA